MPNPRLFHLVVVMALVGCGQSVVVVDTAGQRLDGVRFAHDHTPEQPVKAWYRSHDRTDANGRATVVPMHEWRQYFFVRIECEGYEPIEMPREQFTAYSPTIIVLKPSSGHALHLTSGGTPH